MLPVGALIAGAIGSGTTMLLSPTLRREFLDCGRKVFRKAERVLDAAIEAAVKDEETDEAVKPEEKGSTM